MPRFIYSVITQLISKGPGKSRRLIEGFIRESIGQSRSRPTSA